MTIKKQHIVIEGHAADRMEERGITVDEVVRVMNDGELLERPQPPRFRFHSRLWIRHNWLHVVWAVEKPKLVVVTVYWFKGKEGG